jgi:hypothetical protein
MSIPLRAASAGGAPLRAIPRSIGPQHACTVQALPGRAPYLAFEPKGAGAACATASLVAIHLRPGVTVPEAQALADQINRLLDGVSATVL